LSIDLWLFDFFERDKETKFIETAPLYEPPCPFWLSIKDNIPLSFWLHKLKLNHETEILSLSTNSRSNRLLALYNFKLNVSVKELVGMIFKR